MMFELPLRFDENEWFVLITIVLLAIGFRLIPKIYPRTMLISILIFFAVLALVVDFLLGVDYPFDFYDAMDSPKLELFDVIIYALNYPMYGYFFAYLLYRWELGMAGYSIFILAWSGLTTWVEWISMRFHVFTHLHGWTMGASFIAYLFIFTFSAVVLKWFKRCWSSETGISFTRSRT